MSATLDPPKIRQQSSDVVRDSDSLWEVVNGVLVESIELGAYSNLVKTAIIGFLWLHCRKARVGTAVTETVFILDAESREQRRPDAAYVSADRWPLNKPVPDEGEWRVVPELAIEVISPTDRYHAVLEKIDLYFEYGVLEVWVIDPVLKQAMIHKPAESRSVGKTGTLTTLTTDLIPGLEIPMADLFPPIEISNLNKVDD